MGERKIYFEGQFCIDENGYYIPNKYYILKNATNKNGLDISNSFDIFKKLDAYDSLLEPHDRWRAKATKANDIKKIYYAKTYDDIKSIVTNQERNLETYVFDYGEGIKYFKNVLRNSIDNAYYKFSAKLYNDEETVQINEYSSGWNIRSYVTTSPKEGYGSTVTKLLYSYEGILYDFNQMNNTYTVVSSRSAFEDENSYINLLRKIFRNTNVDSLNISFEDNVIYCEIRGSAIYFEVTDGYVTSIYGKYRNEEGVEYYIEDCVISCNNAYLFSIGSNVIKYLPNVNSKYKVIDNAYYTLFDEYDYELYEVVGFAYNNICNLQTVEEKDAYYERVFSLILQKFDFDNYKLYYKNENNEKVYIDKGTTPQNIYVKLGREFKDPERWIKNYINNVFVDKTIVTFSGEYNGTNFVANFQTNKEKPAYKFLIDNKSYAFIPNNNGRYVVIIDNQYVETIDNLNKYANIIALTDRYYAMKEGLRKDDIKFTYEGGDTFVTGKEKYYTFTYKDVEYKISEFNAPKDAINPYVETSVGRIYLYSYDCDSINGILSDIENYIYNQHCAD